MPIFDANKTLQSAVTRFREKLIGYGLTSEGADHYVEQHREAFSVSADGAVRIDGVPDTADDPVARFARRTVARAAAAMKQPPRAPTQEELDAVRHRFGDLL